MTLSIARRVGRPALLALLALLGVLGTAGPAGADPAEPTDYRSIIQAVEPSAARAVFDVRIVGGDAFLEVGAEPGHEVVVLAYSATGDGRGEPFLRIRADGTVEENLESPYTYSIRDRFGGEAPDGLEPAGPPRWDRIGSGGSYAWHDHRVHWMSPTRKPGIQPGDEVQSWTVPLLVDGAPVTVEGVLRLEEPVSALPWVAVGLVGAAATVLAGRGRSTTVAAAVVTAAAAAAVAAGAGEYLVTPDGAGANPLLVVLPALALVAALAGLVFRRTRLAVIGTLAAVATLGGWAMLRLGVLVHPVLPTELPFVADRAITTLALGCAVGAAALAVRSGALVPRFPELADDEPN